MTRKKKDDARRVQQDLIETVQTWHDGMDLTLCGVDVAECLEYPLMQTLVSIELSKAQEGGGDGR